MYNGASNPMGVCFIIPPYLLDHLADYALTPETRDRAKQNLYLQGMFRGMRGGLAQFNHGGLPTGTLRRSVYAAQHRQDLPGRLVRSEGRRAGADGMANEAYDHAGAAYEFFLNVYGRNSLDGRGGRLDATVHYAQGFDNAFWNGQQMVYGDGDGVLFDRFTKCLDVVGHELVHGITQFSARLEYRGQPGALNESMSDVFGSLVKQYALKQSAEEADWLIGAGLFLPKSGVNRGALRSLKDPGTAYDDPQLGKDPQPSHMRKYYRGGGDYGGVHINSGIPNHAFYLAAMALGGNAWEVAGRVWYEALTTRLRPDSQFAAAAAHTRELARKYGEAAFKAVDEGWRAVGL